MIPTVPYTILDPRASKPEKAYPDDAGIDLAALDRHTLRHGDSINIGTGLAFAIPQGYWGLIQGRSSTWHKRRLVVMPAVIDAGWRGELFVAVHRPHVHGADGLWHELETIQPGERLGQLIILPAFSAHLEYADQLPSHPRGTNGFGSSGH